LPLLEKALALRQSFAPLSDPPPVTLPQAPLHFTVQTLLPIYQKDASSIGKVYVLESVGSIIGGLLMTFLLIQYLNSFEIALIISLINAVVAAILIWPAPKIIEPSC
jgi:spermidine synthase